MRLEALERLGEAKIQTSRMSTSSSSESSRKGERSHTRTIGEYVIGQEIGKGSFATVYKCSSRKSHEAVAIKSVVRSKLKSKKLIENLEIEISILKTMKHPHIVGLLDYHQTASHFHLVMDYCSMGDLSYFIRKRGALAKTHPVISSLLERYPSAEGSHGLNETLVLHCLKQLASALEFLRNKSLVHRDIKPQNLLLCPPMHSKQEFEDAGCVGLWELPVLKIADFGFARFLPSTSMAETLCGSPLYMAPEILRYEKYNAKADLWSVGAVLYEMTVGKPPFRADNHIQLLKNIEKSNDRIKFPSAAKVSEPLKRLIRSLLKYNPTERISFNEFFNDPLIANELEGDDQPLDRSDMDENLFISEYISPVKGTQKVSNAVPKHMTALNEEDVRLENGLKKIHEEYLTEQDATGTPRKDKEIAVSGTGEGRRRDEAIKQIITENSPVGDSVIPLTDNNLHSKTHKKDQDLIFEKDYVMVEKRAVEVNAIADELAHAGSGAVAITPRFISNGENSHANIISNTDAGENQYYRRPSLVNGRPGSNRGSERRISISISPTNALSKAIGLASNRLFGMNPSSAVNNNHALVDSRDKLVSDERISSRGSNNQVSNIISNPNFVNKLLLNKLNLPVSSTVANAISSEDQVNGNMSEDEKVLAQLEAIATKAHAINLFADVKFSQLIPSPPSSNGLDDDLVHQNDMLPPKIVENICEEGVVLYVKALSILAKGMTAASEWWYNKFENTADHDLFNENYMKGVLESDMNVSIKINELVQWIRDRFNECLEKAEFVKLRLQEATKQISDERAKEEGDSTEETSPTKFVAEKLIFDRALEISRNAAVNELVQEDLKGCELAYSTAIWMLEALLDDEIVSDGEKLDEQDRTMIEKFIVSIGNRLAVLKKKLQLI